MKYSYKPRGVCTREMEIETENGKIKKVVMKGGCMGNTLGISSLVEGMEIDEVVDRLDGIQCGYKGTSCPDQLAKALKEIRDMESPRYLRNRDKWLSSDAVDEATKEEIRAIDNDDELKMRFSAPIPFGTAGQRGVMGAGLGRLNVYTVRYTTRALASLIIKEGEEAMKRGVVIAFDCRLHSMEFGYAAAAVLAANGIKARIFKTLTPTPVLSYAIRKLGAQAGINITASHNPVEYNGYKVYWSNGAQLPPKEADVVAAELLKLDIFKDCGAENPDFYIKSGMIEELDFSVEDDFCAEVLSRRIEKGDACLTVVYTPLHGTGRRAVPKVLSAMGVKVIPVPEQMVPDGRFTTAPSPNPENVVAFGLAVETAARNGNTADLLIATDPDADRIGVMVKKDGVSKPLTGNQTGIILLDYIIRARKAAGTLPANCGAISTIVSSPLPAIIAKDNGVRFASTFTGFKFIAETIDAWQGETEFIFGFEESFGYMVGDYVRDKDSVGAAMMICDAAAVYKKEGKTLFDVLDGIYARYGVFCEVTDNIMMKGIDGPEKTAALMKSLRGGIKELGGMKVRYYADYQKATVTELATGAEKPTGMERSNVLKFFFEDGSAVCVRPSGTEPKVKIYYLMRGESEEDCKNKAAAVKKDIEKLTET